MWWERGDGGGGGEDCGGREGLWCFHKIIFQFDIQHANIQGIFIFVS